MKVLVTGAAGFIGMHVCEKLLARGDEGNDPDNFNDYYEVELNEARAMRFAGKPIAVLEQALGIAAQQTSFPCRTALAVL